MNKFILTTLCSSFLSCSLVQAKKYDFTLFHYNIKELDSTKLVVSNKQLQKVKDIIKQYPIDILSINEMQYDFKGVPNKNYVTIGENIFKLQEILGLESLQNSSFYPANTGLNAKAKADGTYFIRPNDSGARRYADQVNFGTMPGQYSTASLTKFKIINEKIITTLKWRDFNKSLDLSKYTGPNGEALPKDMELFDKNFSDVTLDVNGKELHLITLHTVPAFGFGNKKTPNFQRNADQLRFLKWYVTGSSDLGDINLRHINPISGASYIIVGDLNTDISDITKEGSKILNQLMSQSNTWVDKSQMSFTNESSSFEPKPFRLMLDYIITSKDIETVQGKIIHPNMERTDLGCSINTDHIRIAATHRIVKYLDRKKKECFAIVTKNYVDFKTASDHYPIFGKFKFNEDN